MTSRPRATVVMAVRNGEPYLETAIRQIRDQTAHDFEVIVVDDASTDGTQDLLARWGAVDNRVRLLRNDAHAGVARSQNAALDEARGDYLWFTDCDDEWSDHILERLLAAAKSSCADLVVCGATSVRADRSASTPVLGSEGDPPISPEDAVRRVLRGEIEGHLWNKLIHRRLWDGLRFPETRAFSDLAVMGDLMAAATSIAFLDEPLYTYVIRSGSLLNTKEARWRDLLDCAERIDATVARLPSTPGLVRDHRFFRYSAVYIPTLHSMIRRRATGPEAAEVRRLIRAELRLSEITELAGQGKIRVAVASFGLKYAFPVHAAVYLCFRRLKWGSVGYGTS